MSKRILQAVFVAVLSLAFSSELFAQHVIIPTDIQGRRIRTKNYVAVNGSPYLYENWAKGRVKFMNGLIYEGMIKYDQIEDALSFNSASGESQEFADPVFEFSIEDPASATKSNEKMFRKGFGTSPVDEESNNTFFEILSEGNVLLLKRTEKAIVEETPFNSATKIQNIKEITSYYISENSKLTKFKPTEKQLLAILSSKTDQLKSYIKENKLNLKNDEDLIKVIAYYNTIK